MYSMGRVILNYLKKRMKKKKAVKNKKGKIFIQDTGIFTDQILVLEGQEDKKDVFKFLKKEKIKFNFSKWVLEDFDTWKKDTQTKHKALFCWNEEVQGEVIVLRKFEDTWDYWETLIHELNHAVFQISKRKCLTGEMECQAYLQEYLFNQIRKKIMGTISCEYIER